MSSAERKQTEAAKALLRQALEERWPLRHWRAPQVSGWEIMKSPSQDGESLRLSIVWEGGPTVAEVIALAESLPWPVGAKIKLSMRRRDLQPEGKVAIHNVQR